jgi:transposase-like protein
MTGQRFTPEDRLRILQDADQRGSSKETCKAFSISDATFHRQKRQHA